MGAIFRKSKKKPIKVAIPKENSLKTKDNSNGKNDKIPSKDKKDKKEKKNENIAKIIPIPESLNEALNTNENKEKDYQQSPLEEKFSNISSIQNVENPEKKPFLNLREKIPKNDTSIEKIDNDFVEENNEQIENNPHFNKVFLKDPAWANKNIAKKLQEFNWPDKGFVEIKTLCFEIKYEQGVKGFKVLKNNENINSSILSWVKITQEEYYSFDLKDINTFNLKTGQVQQNKRMNEGLKFGVDLQGTYV